MTPSSFFTPSTLLLKERQYKVFRSTYCIKTYTLHNDVHAVFKILLHFCISFLFGATLLCKCIHGWRPSAILWANCIHLHSQMWLQVCLKFFLCKLKFTRPGKQCKSLIWIVIFFSVLICYRGGGKIIVTPTNCANIVQSAFLKVGK